MYRTIAAMYRTIAVTYRRSVCWTGDPVSPQIRQRHTHAGARDRSL
jgi:hypothetical protein